MTDGIHLPKTNRTLWQAGSTVKVAWADEVNHGGGYAYRLCPAAEEQTESCFQRNHLDFVGNTSVVHWTNGTEVTIPARTLSVGTVPAGSQWRRNPFPTIQVGDISKDFPAPCPGCGSGLMNDYSVVDRVAVPVGIAPGEYTLSWRWDCEVTPQVWSGCADVTVADSPDARS